VSWPWRSICNCFIATQSIILNKRYAICDNNRSWPSEDRNENCKLAEQIPSLFCYVKLFQVNVCSHCQLYGYKTFRRFFYSHCKLYGSIYNDSWIVYVGKPYQLQCVFHCFSWKSYTLFHNYYLFYEHNVWDTKGCLKFNNFQFSIVDIISYCVKSWDEKMWLVTLYGMPY